MESADFAKVMIALISVLSAALVGVITALCYFLRRLVDKTIPEQGDRFERVSAAQLLAFREEMASERDECREQHRAQDAKSDQRHSEVMARLERRHPAPTPGLAVAVGDKPA